MHLNEAEKLFYSDIRDKKKAASGVHHKTGKKGYVGVMRFPSDIMSRKDKMKYRRNGKVMTTNIYDEIIPIDEFEKLTKEDQYNRLKYWRSKYSNKEITTSMGIWNNKFYNLVKDLDLPKAPRVEPAERKEKQILK